MPPIRIIGAPQRYAVTAETAADRLAPFARFNRIELCVDELEAWDRALGLIAVPRAGDIVLIKPADLGVFDGSFERFLPFRLAQ